jgi:hypothetical protein
MRRAGIALFFTSLAVNAVLGIGAVLAPDFGRTAVRVLQTSLFVSALLLVCLAVAPAWESGRLGVVPAATAIAAALTVALGILLVWELVERGARLAGTGSVLATAGVLACLLVLARLRPGLRWVLVVDLGLVTLLSLVLVCGIWFEPSSSVYERLMGILLIALAAFVAATPVLHWVSRSALALAEAGADAVRFCPYCGGALGSTETGPVSVCGRCEHRFEVVAKDG